MNNKTQNYLGILINVVQVSIWLSVLSLICEEFIFEDGLTLWSRITGIIFLMLSPPLLVRDIKEIRRLYAGRHS